MNYPDPLKPNLHKSTVKSESYSRAGNSYLFTDEKMIILKSGNRYSIDFMQVGDRTVIEADTIRNKDLDGYILDAEYYRLLQDGISLSHFSTFSDGESAYVLTGPPNTGKTGVNLALNLRGFSFMADENAPVNSSGEALTLQMPLSIGNNNMEDFQTLLNDLSVDYPRSKVKTFRQVRKLPVPLIDKALDRLVEPVTIDPGELNFEDEKKEIDTVFYIQPETRSDIVVDDMEKDEFVHRMILWNDMQRSGFEETYKTWKTEFKEVNDTIESSTDLDRDILESCFENVEIKKLRVPLERQPRKIADFIEDKI